MNKQGEYVYSSAEPNSSHDYLDGQVIDILERVLRDHESPRLFELGCGNGSLAAKVARLGFDVTAVDVSESGIFHANRAYPEISFHTGSAYDDLASRFGQFEVVLSLEVVEHLQWPRTWAGNLFRLLSSDGLAIVSTPYHGYLKNLAISLAGKWDSHMNPLWDHGHIKLWSVRTLSALLTESGFRVESIDRVGRIPIFAKSMVVTATRSEIVE